MDSFCVYTDGATSHNGKKYALGGIGIYFPSNEEWNVSQPFNEINSEFCNQKEVATNQKCELYAILKAILIINQNISNRSILVYSDSNYSIKCVTQWIKQWQKNGWKTKNNKPVQNMHIIKNIYDNITNKSNIFTFIHVNASHDISEPEDKDSISYKNWYGNYCADLLAVQGKNIDYIM